MGVLPDEANLFVCDYKGRQRVAANRKKGADKLKEINGGGLGVVSMKEIVVGESELELSINMQWVSSSICSQMNQPHCWHRTSLCGLFHWLFFGRTGE